MSVKVTISGDGLSFEKETDMLKAGQIIAFLSNDTAQQTGSQYYPAPAGAILGSGNVQRRSPRTALQESDASTNAEKIVVLANFICERDGTQTFSPKEIQVEFKKAGEALPKNFTRDFNQAIATGYILEGEDRGLYLLTDLGLEVAEKGFSEARKTTPTSNGSSKRKGGQKKKITSVREEVDNLEVVPHLDGYPDYWSLSTKGVRVLWLVAFASENNISGLSNVEVSFLASRLKDQIKAGDVTPLTKNNIKKGYMTTLKGLSKILKPGEDFLKEQKQ